MKINQPRNWKKLSALLLLGFASGLPQPLTADTMQAWLKDAHVDLGKIGLFSLVALPYTLEFLWAPFMDRFVPPFLGRRRGWLLVTQILLVFSISAFAFIDPSRSLAVFGFFALLTAFISASQDIVTDAYRTDILKPNELGEGAASSVTGYRFAMIGAGAVSLVIADKLGSWHLVYFLMAVWMIAGIAATIFADEPESVSAPLSLREAVVNPFKEIALRRGGWFAIGFIILFKLPDVIAAAMTTPFMLDIGISKTEIGTIRQGLGLLITIVGTIVGGAITSKIGLKRALWVFGLLQAVSNLGFLILAKTGNVFLATVSVIGVENFCTGLVTAGFVAFLMSQCSPKFSATQYALLTSVMALTRVFGGAPTGYLVEHTGWGAFFILSIFAGIPGMLLIPFLKFREENILEA